MKSRFKITQNFLNNLAMLLAVLSVFIFILAIGLDRYAASITPTLTPTPSNTPRPSRTPYPPTATVTPTATLEVLQLPLPDEPAFQITPDDFMSRLEGLGYTCQPSSRLLQQGFEWICTRSTEQFSQEVLFQGREVNVIDYAWLVNQQQAPAQNEISMDFFLGTLSLLFPEEVPVALTPLGTADPAGMATESPTVSPYDEAATWLQNTLPLLSLENTQEDVVIDGIPCSLIQELPDETQTVQILGLGFPLVAP